MSIQTARLDLRLTDADKRRIERAANLLDMPVSVFVREAVLREADQAIARPPAKRGATLSRQLRGRATTRLGTDEIMRLTRGA